MAETERASRVHGVATRTSGRYVGSRTYLPKSAASAGLAKRRSTVFPAGKTRGFRAMADYAIISVGGKQYRVREGDKLLVDRLSAEEGKTFHPNLLFVGGDGKADLKPKAQVTAKVVGHVL